MGKKLDDTVTFLGIDFNNDTLISYVTAAAFLMVSFFVPIPFWNCRLRRK